MELTCRENGALLSGSLSRGVVVASRACISWITITTISISGSRKASVSRGLVVCDMELRRLAIRADVTEASALVHSPHLPMQVGEVLLDELCANWLLVRGRSDLVDRSHKKNTAHAGKHIVLEDADRDDDGWTGPSGLVLRGAVV